MIIQRVKTGRRWGDKREPVRGRAQVGTAKIEFEEYDHWDGPIEAGEEGEYIRDTCIIKIGRIEWP